MRAARPRGEAAAPEGAGGLAAGSNFRGRRVTGRRAEPGTCSAAVRGGGLAVSRTAAGAHCATAARGRRVAHEHSLLGAPGAQARDGPVPTGQDLSRVPVATRPGPAVGAPGAQQLHVCVDDKRGATGVGGELPSAPRTVRAQRAWQGERGELRSHRGPLPPGGHLDLALGGTGLWALRQVEGSERQARGRRRRQVSPDEANEGWARPQDSKAGGAHRGSTGGRGEGWCLPCRRPRLPGGMDWRAELRGQLSARSKTLGG